MGISLNIHEKRMYWERLTDKDDGSYDSCGSLVGNAPCGNENLECLKYLWDVKKEYFAERYGWSKFGDLCIYYAQDYDLCQLTYDELAKFIRLYDLDLKRCGCDYRVAESVLNTMKGLEYVWIDWG